MLHTCAPGTTTSPSPTHPQTDPSPRPQTSQSQRILWLLEELHLAYGLPYTVVHHFRVSGRAPPELAAVHPSGKSPLLVTPDGRVVSESLAIATYLIRTYDTAHRFGVHDAGAGDAATSVPTGSALAHDWLRDEELTSLAATSYTWLATMHFTLLLVVEKVPFVVRPVFALVAWALKSQLTRPGMDGVLKLMEGELGTQAYFMGEEPTRPDFMFSFPVDMMAQRGQIEWGKYPGLAAWRERVLARPAWKNALSKVSLPVCAGVGGRSGADLRACLWCRGMAMIGTASEDIWISVCTENVCVIVLPSRGMWFGRGGDKG